MTWDTLTGLLGTAWMHLLYRVKVRSVLLSKVKIYEIEKGDRHWRRYWRDCTAIHLAKHGFQVTVVEKNDRPGGRCDHFTRDGHIFDTGPTLLVMRLLYEEEFAALGARC